MMTLMERMRNLQGSIHGEWLMHGSLSKFDALFQRHFPHSPSMMELGAKASYYFVNSEPLIDFPRPVTRKVADIGGIVVPPKAKPLNEHLSGLLSLRTTAVLISFGTVMQTAKMPEQFKETIRQLSIQMPNITFICKYERPEDNVARGIPNLVTESWLPQADLLSQ